MVPVKIARTKQVKLPALVSWSWPVSNIDRVREQVLLSKPITLRASAVCGKEGSSGCTLLGVKSKMPLEKWQPSRESMEQHAFGGDFNVEPCQNTLPGGTVSMVRPERRMQFHSKRILWS